MMLHVPRHARTPGAPGILGGDALGRNAQIPKEEVVVDLANTTHRKGGIPKGGRSWHTQTVLVNMVKTE